MSVLFCDTNCELWHTTAKDLGLEVIRMPYTLDGTEYYYDLGEKTDFKFFFSRLRDKATAITSALNEYNYTEYFEPWFMKGEDIFYISFSHKMSATFNSMQRAVDALLEKYPERKFTVFDTKGISLAAGIQVYYAAKLHQAGASDEEMLALLNNLRDRTVCFFVVDDLQFLKRGGRISAAAANIGTLFGVKPILTFKDGAIINSAKVQGRKIAFSRMLKEYEMNHCADYTDVWIVGADCDDDCVAMEERIKAITPDVVVHRQSVGPVIGSHCGPDTVGLIFIKKQ